MSIGNPILDEVIASYQHEKGSEYRIRSEKRHQSIQGLKERDRQRLLAEQNEIVESIVSFRKLLKGLADRGDPRSRTFRKILSAFDHYDPAKPPKSPLYKSFGLNKTNYNALLKLGKELLIHDQHVHALPLYKVLTYLDYDNTEARVGLALSYFFNHKTEKSLGCAWKAHRIDPKNIGPLLCQLVCLEQQGKWEEAELLIENLNGVKGELNKSLKKMIDTHAKFIADCLKSRGGKYG